MLQEFSRDQFFINDISFIFEMSRKRSISPYAIVVALIYLNRLKNKPKSSNSYETWHSSLNGSNEKEFDKYSANYLTNTELCLISLVKN
jgi:hypothetical protein